MPVFGTGDLRNLPRQFADGLVRTTQTGSVVAALSNRTPMRFGATDIVTFPDLPRAEFVEEGANKASTDAGFGVVTAVPHKAQVTMRFTEEVLWADEDHQLGVLDELGRAGGESLARALDLGLIHRVNPLTGAAIAGWTNYLNATANRVTTGGNEDTEIEAAVGLIVGATVPVTGVAMDPAFSWSLATTRDAQGNRRYPELGFGTNVTNFLGLATSVSSTVSGRPEAADTRARAIVGDFTGGIRWGVQREIPLELIRYGDPDGQGDLKRNNQIALRLEILYGWYVFPERFAVVETAAV